MGQAKQRGSFEERRAKTIAAAKLAASLAELRHRATARKRRHIVAALAAQLAAMGKD